MLGRYKQHGGANQEKVTKQTCEARDGSQHDTISSSCPNKYHQGSHSNDYLLSVVFKAATLISHQTMMRISSS